MGLFGVILMLSKDPSRSIQERSTTINLRKQKQLQNTITIVIAK
jgi:hypothetical protein